MKTKNAAFTDFLDKSYIPLELKYKWIIAALLFIIPLVIFYFVFLKPNLEELDKLTNKEASLETELEDVKARSLNLPKLEAELSSSEKVFEEKATLLPKQKEIPQLLRDISSRGRTAGLDFLNFKPLASTPKDFYEEIPININIRGPYHNVGYFFDQVSKLDRIVSVSNVKMTAPKLEDGEMLLSSNCKLVTYQFTGKKLPEQKK